MTILCKLNDGSTTSIDGFVYDQFSMEARIDVDAVRQHLITVNCYRRRNGIPERDLTDVCALFDCAEFPFSIESVGKGVLERVPYGKSPTFWAKHA